MFFNNTVGNLFTDPALRQSLVEFVYGGGGMMGVHGTSVAFTQWPGAVEDWPEFGLMIGARGANHRASDEHVFIKLDDPAHPVNQAFGGQGFDYRDEFFRVHDPYSRKRVRVLFSIDNDKTDFKQDPRFTKPERADNDFALAWVRNYGRGRTFYCTIAHNPVRVPRPEDAAVLPGGGAVRPGRSAGADDSERAASLRPSAPRRSSAGGWASRPTPSTSSRSSRRSRRPPRSACRSWAASASRRSATSIPKNFEPGLSDDELRQIRFKLDAAGVRLLTYYIQDIPGDEAGCRKVFEFGRKIGIETFMSEPKPEALDTIEKFCDAYDINVALHNHDAKASPVYWNPAGILKACEGRSKRLGACADLGYWMRAGIDPIQAVRQLKDRLITVQMHDLHARGADGHDVPWGTGVGNTEAFLKELHRLGIRPTMFGLEYSYNWLESMPEIAKCIAFFNQVSLELANGG